MDLGFQAATRPPRFNFNLVVARGGWQSHKSVTFDPVATPAINRVDLKQEIGPFSDFLSLSQELEVDWEREVAHVLCSFYVVVVIDKLD